MRSVPAMPDLARAATSAARSRGLHQQPALSQEQLPGVGQQHRAAGAGQQRRPELAFQLQDGLAQRRLGHVEPLRRAAEVQFFGDRNEVPGLPYFDHAIESSFVLQQYATQTFTISIRGLSTGSMTSQASLLERFAALDSAAVSDALDALGLPPGQAGFLPVWGTPKIAGFAVTVQLEPYVPGPSGAHIGATAVADANSSNVIVVANDGPHRRVLLGRAPQPGRVPQRRPRRRRRRRLPRRPRGPRDRLPGLRQGRIPATARGRLQQRSTGEPVQLGGVTVTPGDLVLADETGVVVVPSSHLDEVLERAQGVAAREQAIAADLRAGVALPEAMRDARLAGTTRGALMNTTTEATVIERLSALAHRLHLRRDGLPRPPRHAPRPRPV